MVPNKFNGYSSDGRRLYYKGGGGGGGKAIVGMVAGIALPFAIPALATAISSSAVVASAYGAAVGFASTGTMQGALMGGVTGGIGQATGLSSNMFGGGDGGTVAGNIAPGSLDAGPGAFPITTDAVPSLPGFNPSVDAAPAAGGLTGGAQPGSFDAGLPGGAQSGAPTLTNQQPAGLTAPSNSGLINGPQASTAPTSLVPDGSLDGGPAATPVDPAAAKAVANAAPGQSFGSKLMANLTNPDNLASAGLRLGTQMIGGAMSKPDMGPLNSYLNDMQGQQAQANQFNMAQADKKNAVGDKLQVAADNYDPGYMAGLSFANTSNANAMGMQQRVAQARARGASDEEINAMQAEGQVAGTGQANAAWNSGMSSAKGTQAGLYSSAGSMYGQVTPPNASLAGAYSNVAQMNQNAKTAGGYALEQAFQPVTKTTNTGAATT